MQTRLTVFLSGPNNYKGNLFDGTAPVDVTNFSKIKDTEQQMTLAPAVGMISPYMNNDDVWESFCDTYNAIYNCRFALTDDVSRYSRHHRQTSIGVI